MALSLNTSISGTASLELSNNKKVSLGEQEHTYEAYVKVAHVTCSKDKCKADVYFLDKQNNIIYRSDSYTFSMDLEGPNNIKQAYEYLKTLPEFTDAVDC